ncbi:aldo/keto reductase [Swaminathania salitolerans]|uniref:Oxidoreductase n=1 Tax=Swaminathania salitolerans TaxID=182838 RepID=A0A511BLY9_9PROT|nr:aldo/keto reductase [Swaminathania salitolerans]GBQ15431.1 putative aldo/keto reductase [Swaminathania salitolerans LMG 21291]GEL01350.1 oxidoreductase [Swaminathania salitolerans]
MNYRKLGRTGLKVSPLCLGAMNFGDVTAEPDSFRIMDEALAAGINYFDTADVYGGPQTPDMEKGYGTSEEIIGNWFERSGQRNSVVLATKFYQPMGTGPNDRGLSAFHIREACEASLKRLKTDRIDLYQMHHSDMSVPQDELWQALDLLVAQGKILYVGSSNHAGWQIATTHLAAQARGSLGLVSEQSYYNLMERTVELEVLPACRHHGLGLVCWSPLNRGLLGGVLHASANGRRARPDVKENIDRHRPQLERYESFCAGLGAPPAAVAMAWLRQNPVVTAPIIGPRTLEQLNAALDSLSLELSREDLATLDEIWPGPGGQAPQAYAW